ncbi:helix-turn-helix transcriptional regulator [Streptococcus agalactiae]|uniref:helix-turn-helix domain-containing protein n=1 Tax=Streptococcus agalactiae TaxID=1311 RepID=UPI001F4E6B65|nr:helix-turn-helix transcriptional regulator [Streptococcus agalactiae]MCH9591306.1 helix-turn-helix transcriptional regulator [Streptococcus agalactiae]
MQNRLKELRKEKGLTQAELAKVLNTNQSQYGKYENGKTNLSLENSKILADFFGVSVGYLLGDETKIPINTNTEIFKQLKSINQLKSQLLSELLDLDNQEKELFSKLNE